MIEIAIRQIGIFALSDPLLIAFELRRCALTYVSKGNDMENNTPRFALPQLFVAQAQKEITHNEALVLVDAALHPVVEAVVSVPPVPSSNDRGKCWLVGANAVGAFLTRENQIALWTGGSWRFLLPTDGMWVWQRNAQSFQYFISQQWTVVENVLPPTGGGMVDQECRAALTALIDKLGTIGLLSGN